MELRIKYEEIQSDLTGATETFPKYTTQIINLANQNAQGTRPKIVGQLSELIQEFSGRTYSDWISWYQSNYPNAIVDATSKITGMIQNLKGAFDKIDNHLVRRWVEDLVLAKTYTGFRFQESILRTISRIENLSYRLSQPSEESQGIDGFLGDTPVSIKPESYKSKQMLQETIMVKMIFYSKLKDGILVKYNL